MDMRVGGIEYESVCLQVRMDVKESREKKKKKSANVKNIGYAYRRWKIVIWKKKRTKRYNKKGMKMNRRPVKYKPKKYGHVLCSVLTSAY